MSSTDRPTGETASPGEAPPYVRLSGNVFADFGFDPEEAANLQIRSRLAVEVMRWIKTEGLTQAEAAARLGVTQPRISDLSRGKLDLFSIDGLVNMLAAAGRRVEMRVVEGTSPVHAEAA